MRRVINARLWRMIPALFAMVFCGCGEDTVAPHEHAAVVLDPVNPVIDLDAAATTDSSVALEWRRPSGQTAGFEIYYTSDPLATLTEGGWEAATKLNAQLEDACRTSGAGCSYVVNGLSQRTNYFFAMRTLGTDDRKSALSNVAEAMTNEVAPVFERSWGSPGSEPGQFKNPNRIAAPVDGPIFSSGVFVADGGNHRVQWFGDDGKFYAMWGSPCNLATGEGCVDPDGPGPLELGDGQFWNPTAIAVDLYGNVYVGDDNSRVQVFEKSGQFIRFIRKWNVVAAIEDIAVDDAGDVYVAFWDENPSRYDNAGNLKTIFFAGTRYNKSIAVDGFGHVYVGTSTGTGTEKVTKFTKYGKRLLYWEGFGSVEDVGVDTFGDVYVVDDSRNQIKKFTSEGVFLSMWGSAGSSEGQFARAQSIALARLGSTFDQVYVFVLDAGENQTRIQKFLHG